MIFDKSSYQLPIELTMPTICIFIAYRLDYYEKSSGVTTEFSCLFGDDREKEIYRGVSFLNDKKTLRIRGTNSECVVDHSE